MTLLVDSQKKFNKQNKTHVLLLRSNFIIKYQNYSIDEFIYEKMGKQKVNIKNREKKLTIIDNSETKQVCNIEE